MAPGEEQIKCHVFTGFKPSLNPDIDMEYGAKFSLFELIKGHL
jgi:hypothetical protein